MRSGYRQRELVGKELGGDVMCARTRGEEGYCTRGWWGRAQWEATYVVLEVGILE